MSEAPREEKKEQSQASPSNSNSASDRATILQIEEHLARATSIEEMERWTRVREQVLQQDEVVKDGKQRRLLERIQVISKIGFSLGVFIIGIIFVFREIPGFGSVLAGAGIYLIVPEYVREVFLKREEDEADKKRKNNITRSSLTVGLLLTSITGVALYAVGKTTVLSALVQVLLTISGMTTIAALAAFDQYRKLGIYVGNLPFNTQKTDQE